MSNKLEHGTHMLASALIRHLQLAVKLGGDKPVVLCVDGFNEADIGLAVNLQDKIILHHHKRASNSSKSCTDLYGE